MSRGALHYREYFYVGQTYTPSGSSTIAHSQIYVEHLTPASVTKKFPIVMIHGYGMTATNWLSTPDGRKGWADWFLENGFEVYLIDQPSRGRSAHHSHIDGPLGTLDTLTVQRMFTATAKYDLWPSANLHTQWPGSGISGDDVFDEFYASTMPSLFDMVEVCNKMRDAGAQLLDLIGRQVILMTHSQSGQFGWLLADARPSLVKAIIALDPSGPPFFDSSIFRIPSPPSDTPAPSAKSDCVPARPYGLTEIPITFFPPITSPSELFVQIVDDSSPYFINAQQEEPARKLINLVNIHTLVVTGEASYHSVYDHCSAEFLKQAGVPVDHVKLGEVGIRGNGHLMFLEKNGVEILERVVRPWIEKVTID